jgi:hypothetical protein
VTRQRRVILSEAKDLARRVSLSEAKDLAA